MEQCFYFARKRKPATRDMRIVERLDTHVVASAKELARRAIPYCEGEVSEQMLDAVFTPLFVGSQQQNTVWNRVAEILVNCECLQQTFSIVQTDIAGHGETPFRHR